MLSFYFQNVRGLRTKLKDFYLATLQESYDIVLINESWLNDSIANSEFFSPNFNVYRKDRDPILSGKKDGGGIIIAVRCTLNSLVKEEWSCDGIVEDLWVQIVLDSGKKLNICCTYVPPHASQYNLQSHLDRVSEIVLENVDDLFLVIGDYNAPDIRWTLDNIKNCYLPNPTKSDSELLVDSYNLLNLKQFNGVTNTNNVVLDLCFSNLDDIIIRSSSTSFVNEDSNHPALELFIKTPNLKFSKKLSYKTFQFKKANYDIINNRINSIDWANNFMHLDSNAMVTLLYKDLNKIICENVNSKLINKKFPIWFSPATKRLLKTKIKLHKKWKKYRNNNDYVSFSSVRKQLKKHIDLDYKNYVSQTEQNLELNTKSFWSFVSNKNKSQKIPSTMSYQGQEINTNQGICDGFSQFFSSVFIPNTLETNISVTPNTVDIFSINCITREQISGHLNKLDISKSCGPDNIPAIFIKLCASSLTDPLYFIYNKSLKEGIFPDEWKLANVVPIFKGGNKGVIENYRGVSLLCIFGKVFEAIITEELFFMAKNKISVNQHGFYRGRSTTTALLPLVQTVLESMSEHRQVDAVYTDFSKAFDRVHHCTLLIRLENFGVHGNLLRWIQSYLGNRTQVVKLNNTVSREVKVTSGVPQGSHLGPLLFLIFINEIGNCFQHCMYSLYADDLKLFAVIETPIQQILVQEDLNRLSNFCSSLRLSLNINKCCSITFSRSKQIHKSEYHINNNKLQDVQQIKDLGVILDSKMTFEYHIDHIVRKALKNLGFIIRTTKDFSSVKSCIILYNSLVRSHLEYAAIIWNPYYQKYIYRIERVQKKFINFINFQFNKRRYFDTYSNNLKFYRVESLENRRSICYIIFLYKILNNKVDSFFCTQSILYAVHNHSVRNQHLFKLHLANTNYLLNSPVTRMQEMYNVKFADIDLFHLSLSSVRRMCLSKFS